MLSCLGLIVLLFACLTGGWLCMVTWFAYGFGLIVWFYLVCSFVWGVCCWFVVFVYVFTCCLTLLYLFCWFVLMIGGVWFDGNCVYDLDWWLWVLELFVIDVGFFGFVLGLTLELLFCWNFRLFFGVCWGGLTFICFVVIV